MEPSEAIAMLRHPALTNGAPGTWADLGSGQGVFTQALASLLPAGSQIMAIDTDASALLKIPQSNSIPISTLVADFTRSLSLPQLKGILMANSFHYVQDQEGFLHGVKQYLQPGGWLLMVEYDMIRGNPWVPYPVSFSALQELFSKAGFSVPEKIGERRSIYNRSIMYSCIAQLG
ncbi:MAG: methyltransferase domain-containing protein [Chitinophagaceae bacterium]|nr:methyltransferase domain-containing protein [Chitinophagaceae bacterium]